MNCIFCHSISDNSKSVEHVIPESLGNKEHVLKQGIVCDKCNSYFAIKIEKELLEQPYFISLRHRNMIQTKKNHFVPQKVFLPHSKSGWVDAWLDYSKDGFRLCLEQDANIKSLIKTGKTNKMYAPVIPEPEPDNYTMSRFLTKCAFEYLVLRIDDEEFISHLREEQFTPIRKYARYGDGVKFWPYHQRRIYSEGNWFINEKENGSQPYEILHELDLLSLNCKSTDGIFYCELYFVVVIMGIEYVVNIAEPEIDSYKKWLNENNQKCPIRRGSEKELGSSKADDFPLLIK